MYTRTGPSVGIGINKSKLLNFMYCKQNENINFMLLL